MNQNPKRPSNIDEIISKCLNPESKESICEKQNGRCESCPQVKCGCKK